MVPTLIELDIMAASLGRSLLYTSVIASSPDRHHQGIGDLPGRYPCTHRPADEHSGEENDDGGHVEPALSRPDVGEAICGWEQALRSCDRAHCRVGRRWRPIKPSYAPARWTASENVRMVEQTFDPGIKVR